MGKKIIYIYQIRQRYVVLDDNNIYELRPYERVYVFKIHSIKKILDNPDSLNDILNSGFNLVYNDGKTEKVPLSIDYVQNYAIIQQQERQKLIKEFESYKDLSENEKEDKKYHLNYLKNRITDVKSFDDIYIYREINSKDIREFYEFSSQVEINNIRPDYWIFDSRIDCIYIGGEPKGIQNYELYQKTWGVAKQYSGAPDDRGRYYKFPVSEIDKIIGLKKDFVVDSFDKDEYEYNGETKEYILDLHQFDENIYETLKSYHVVEFKKVHDDEKKEPEKQSWWNKFFGKKIKN